jgi:hypothetical protein
MQSAQKEPQSTRKEMQSTQKEITGKREATPDKKGSFARETEPSKKKPRVSDEETTNNPDSSQGKDQKALSDRSNKNTCDFDDEIKKLPKDKVSFLLDPGLFIELLIYYQIIGVCVDRGNRGRRRF